MRSTHYSRCSVPLSIFRDTSRTSSLPAKRVLGPYHARIPPKLRKVGRSRLKCANASAAEVSVAPRNVNRRNERELVLPPIPEPPSSASLQHVLPYLAELAFTDKHLYWRLGVAALCVVVSKATGLMAPVFLKHAVEHVSAASVGAAAMAIILSGLCRVVSGVAKEIQYPVFTPVSQAAARKVASNTFAHVLDLDVQFHLDRQTGTLSRVLERGTRSVQMMFRIVVFTFLPTFVELALVCGILGHSFSPVVSAVVVATFVGYITWTLRMTKVATEIRKKVNEFDNLTTGKAVDVLQNFETVALFNNQSLEVSQYDEYLVGYQNASVEIEKKSALLNSGQSVVLTLGLTSALVLSLACATSPVSAGDLVLIQGLLLQLWLPLQFLGWFYRELRQSLIDMEEFLKILQTKSTLPDGDSELPERMSSSRTHNGHSGNGHSHNGGDHDDHADAPPSFSGRGVAVELNNVTFGYTPERQVVKGVSLKIKPGQSVALVGGSGSGKSTVLKLIVRLYDVDGGSISIDGLDVRDLKQSSLRSAVGVVPQDTVLFNDTIMQNIMYGDPSAGDDEAYEAAKMAQLHETIARMPSGYETVVGERGLKLSGGEKQRVAIARTFLRAPRLLVCDEATSALDTATEQEIMSSLNKLAEGRTSVFVAHRLSTIRNCDVIVVMSDGKVVEQGTHEELMGMGQVYYDMWTSQADEKERSDQCMALLN